MTEKLFELAFRFRDRELWADLDDNQIFAVQLHDDKIGYCCVMGSTGAHMALGLYIGQEGWNTYIEQIRLVTKEFDHDESTQMMGKMDCINCDFAPVMFAKDGPVKKEILAYAKKKGFRTSGRDGLPEFVRYRPFMYPLVDLPGDDEQYMTTALEAALFLDRCLDDEANFEKFGFNDRGYSPDERPGRQVPLFIPKGNSFEISTTSLPGYNPVVFPKAIFNLPAMAMSIQQLKFGSDLECRQIVIPTPVLEEGEAFFPVTLMYVRSTDGYVSVTKAAMMNDKTAPDAVMEFASAMLANGARPRKIFVEEDRTQLLLEDLCKKCGIQLVRASRLKHLKEAWSALNLHFGQK